MHPSFANSLSFSFTLYSHLNQFRTFILGKQNYQTLLFLLHSPHFLLPLIPQPLLLTATATMTLILTHHAPLLATRSLRLWTILHRRLACPPSRRSEVAMPGIIIAKCNRSEAPFILLDFPLILFFFTNHFWGFHFVEPRTRFSLLHNTCHFILRFFDCPLFFFALQSEAAIEGEAIAEVKKNFVPFCWCFNLCVLDYC